MVAVLPRTVRKQYEPQAHISYADNLGIRKTSESAKQISGYPDMLQRFLNEKATESGWTPVTRRMTAE